MRRIVVIALAIAFATTACSDRSGDLVGDDLRAFDASRTTPDIKGVVTRVNLPSSGRRTILVEEKPGELSGSAKALTTVADTIQIVRRSASGSERPATVADIANGQRVEVWFIGPVAESYPVQATARRVVIVE
jgi:hypothetical protein